MIRIAAATMILAQCTTLSCAAPNAVPYPGSVAPDEVVANIQASVRGTAFAASLGIDDFATARLTAARILQVRSDMPPPGFFVVELDDAQSHPVAVVAIMRDGVMLAAQDVRVHPSIRPIDLTDAAARVKARLGLDAIATEYLYAHNTAEPGLSILRPLAVVHTAKGSVYFNTRREAFAEQGAELLEGRRSHASAVSQALVLHWLWTEHLAR